MATTPVKKLSDVKRDIGMRASDELTGKTVIITEIVGFETWGSDDDKTMVLFRVGNDLYHTSSPGVVRDLKEVHNVGAVPIEVTFKSRTTRSGFKTLVLE